MKARPIREDALVAILEAKAGHLLVLVLLITTVVVLDVDLVPLAGDRPAGR